MMMETRRRRRRRGVFLFAFFTQAITTTTTKAWLPLPIIARSNFHHQHQRPSSSFSSTPPLLFSSSSSTESSGSPTDDAKSSSSSLITIYNDFDGANIQVVDILQDDDNDDSTTTKADSTVVSLHIRPDPFSELEQTQHFQYFCFAASATASSQQQQQQDVDVVTYQITNAGQASYAFAFQDYTVCWSTNPADLNAWKRSRDTHYDAQEGILRWTHRHNNINKNGDEERVTFCYFPPYPYARHVALIEACRRKQQQRHDAAPMTTMTPTKTLVLSKSLEGRDIECVVVGHGPLKAWMIHRQHPGEHMAEYYAEGLLERLLGRELLVVVDDDAATGDATAVSSLSENADDVMLEDNDNDDASVVARALQEYTFYIVPSMNPDGGCRGHLRTNAAGANLNREWAPSQKRLYDATTNTTTTEPYDAPTLQRSPEVYGVFAKMKEVGCDAFVDVHGDEGLPFNFLAKSNVPNWGPRLQGLHGAFLASYGRVNSDMQANYSYPPFPFRQGSPMNIASSRVAYTFDCLAVTLEMPFKDCLSNSDPERGWTPLRAKALGASLVDALAYVSPYLRTESEFWNDLPPEDAYIVPTYRYKDATESR